MSTSTLHRLFISFQDGPYVGRTLELQKEYIAIGSDQNKNHLAIPGSSLQPEHAYIAQSQGQVYLQAHDPTFYMAVNAIQVPYANLHNGDIVTLGTSPGITFQITIEAGVAPTNDLTRNNMQAPLNTGGMRGLAASQPQQSAWPGATPGQMPSTGRTHAYGQQQQVFAPQVQPSTQNTVTDTTRYLCVAGQLDEEFQDYMMRNVIYEERRALGESYGVDMPTVVSWCQAGLHRINARDWFMSILIALVIFSYFLIPAIINSLLNSPSLPFSVYFLLLGIAHFFSGATLVLALIILPIAFNLEKWLKRRWPTSLPGLITYPILFALFAPFSLLIIPLAWFIIFVELLFRYYGEPIKRLRKHTFNPQAKPVLLDAHLERKLQENFSTGQRNVIAYTGYRPFAGAGNYKTDWSWSFVVDTSKGAYDTSTLLSTPARKTPQPFTISSLYDAIEKDVWALGIKDVLEIESKLYVRGQYLSENPRFFNEKAIRPVTSVDPEVIAQYKENSTEDIRYYQCLRFNFWRGQMVLTAFLRFVQRGKELFTEIDYLLLPPMKPDYRWADEKELTPLINKIWELYKRSLDTPVQMWLGAPFRLLRGYFYTMEQRKLARFALNAPAFDYGASTSVRQQASDSTHHLFFQRLDEKMYLQIIEKQILETAINFLDAHQIDTTEFRQREQAILNNNTVNNNFGGQMFTGNNNTITGNTMKNNNSTPPSTKQGN